MVHIRHTLIGLCVAAASVGVLAQGADGHRTTTRRKRPPLRRQLRRRLQHRHRRP